MNRVVVTGIGAVTPFGKGIDKLLVGLKEASILFKQYEQSVGAQSKFYYGAIPSLASDEIEKFKDTYRLIKLRSSAILYGCTAGVEAWTDAKLPFPNREDTEPLWEAGTIFGTSCGGVEASCYNIQLASEGNGRKIGGRIAQQAMNSGISAYLGGILGLGNQVSTNSSEGNTGLEAIIMAWRRIAIGKADIMLAGSTESSMLHVHDAYENMRIDDGEKAMYTGESSDGFSPLSEEKGGFIVGSGAGALVLENLDSALKRGATIYGEIVAVNISSGGQREGSSLMTLNGEALTTCISELLKDSNISEQTISLLNGYFQNNYCDDIELSAIVDAFISKNVSAEYVNISKSIIGNCLSSSGTIETIISIVELSHNFIHANRTPQGISDSNQKLLNKIKATSVFQTTMSELSDFVKISYGVGDVIGGIYFKKWINE